MISDNIYITFKRNIPILLDKILFFAITFSVDLCLNYNAAQEINEQSTMRYHYKKWVANRKNPPYLEALNLSREIAKSQPLVTRSKAGKRLPYQTPQNRSPAKLLKFRSY